MPLKSATYRALTRGSSPKLKRVLAARIAVWAFFLLVVASAVTLSQSALGGTTSAAFGHGTPVATLYADGASNSSVAVASTGPGSCASGTCSVQAQNPSSPMLCNNTAQVTCYEKYSKSPELLLPAWRWSSSTGLYSSLGVGDVFANIMGIVADLCFLLASWLWLLLLFMINWALNMNLVDQAASTINSAFSALASHMQFNGPVPWIAIFVGGLAVIRALLKGAVGKVFRTVLVVVIPLSTLWALSAGLTTSSSGEIPKGSPAWLAQTGSHYVNVIAGEMATGFGTVSSGSSQLASNNGVTPSCASYLAALYDQYYAYSSEAAKSVSTSTSTLTDQSAWANSQQNLAAQLHNASNYGMTAVSGLWEQAYLTNWIDAQYGSLASGNEMYCHQLDNSAHLSVNEQMDLLAISGRYDGYNYTKVSPQVFYPFDPSQGNHAKWHYEAELYSWAACHIGNSISVDPGWAVVVNGDGPITPADCKTYLTQSPTQGLSSAVNADGSQIAAWSAANTPKGGDSWFTTVTNDVGLGGSSSAGALDGYGMFNGFNYGTADGLGSDVTSAQASPGAASQSQITNVATTVSAFWGHNDTQRLIDGLMALITAAVYLYALGALALGSVMAQLGLVLLLCLLPVTLVLLAIPTKNAESSTAGSKMLKMTFGFFVSKLTLTLVLLLLIQAIGIFQNLLKDWATGGYSSIFHAAVPLVCLFLVRKLLAVVGVGNITSLSGAVGMPLAAGMIATGDQKLARNVSSSFSRGAERAGLNKADAAFKRDSKRGSKFLAGWAAGKTSQRLGLPLMRNQLLGRKDADGNLKEFGLVHRVSSLAGLLNYAQSERLGAFGSAVSGFLNTNRVGSKIRDHAEYRDRIRPTGSIDVIEAQMRERWMLLSQTFNKGGQSRREAYSQFYSERVSSMLDYQEGLRNRRGELVVDRNGNTVYGYSVASGKAHDPGGSIANVLREDKKTDARVYQATMELLNETRALRRATENQGDRIVEATLTQGQRLGAVLLNPSSVMGGREVEGFAAQATARISLETDVHRVIEEFRSAARPGA